jgi:hypothetical protein
MNRVATFDDEAGDFTDRSKDVGGWGVQGVSTPLKKISAREIEAIEFVHGIPPFVGSRSRCLAQKSDFSHMSKVGPFGGLIYPPS